MLFRYFKNIGTHKNVGTKKIIYISQQIPFLAHYSFHQKFKMYCLFISIYFILILIQQHRTRMYCDDHIFFILSKIKNRLLDRIPSVNSYYLKLIINMCYIWLSHEHILIKKCVLVLNCYWNYLHPLSIFIILIIAWKVFNPFF